MSVSAIQEWMEDAPCRELDPEQFFTDNRKERKEIQKLYCDGCEVRAKCLEYSLRNKEEYGIWGGLDAPKRRKLFKGKDGGK